MKRTLVIAGLGLTSMVNVASAEGRWRRGDCDRRSEIRSSDRFDRWNPRQAYGYRGNRDIYQDRYEDRRRDNDRSTAASVGIVAGSAAGGAAIGGIAAGGKGAAIGAIIGGAAGLVYDQATREDDRDRYRRYRR